MNNLRDLYQEVIIDHSRSPRNFCVLDDADRKAEGFNPLCGDRLHLFLKFQDDKIVDASFDGYGCAISTASASIMTDLLKGLSEQEARQWFERVHAMLTGQDTKQEDMGKLAVLSGVKAYPARVKCASLAWHTLIAALDNRADVATTE